MRNRMRGKSHCWFKEAERQSGLDQNAQEVGDSQPSFRHGTCFLTSGAAVVTLKPLLGLGWGGPPAVRLPKVPTGKMPNAPNALMHQFPTTVLRSPGPAV